MGGLDELFEQLQGGRPRKLNASDQQELWRIGRQQRQQPQQQGTNAA